MFLVSRLQQLSGYNLKSIFITGADKGLGWALLKNFVSFNKKVFPHFLNESSAKSRMRLNGGSSLFGNLSDEKVLIKAIDFVSRIKSLDLVILNAAIFPREKTEKVKLKEWNEVINLNLTVPFF
jgi:NAD(P)-dependent dehydrogenase (short-subunit alcohol dehydrogenase family)